MDQAASQDRTDFHAAPKVRDRLSKITLLLEPVLHGLESRAGMVIRHSQLSQSLGGRLMNQRQRFKAAVAAEGMAVEIELARTAVGTNRLENRSQGMAINWHGTPFWRRLHVQQQPSLPN